LKKKIRTILYFITGLIICIGCKEESGLIGIGDQSDRDFLNTDYFDTTTLIAYSALHDSLITSNVSTNMLGYIHDPVFGRTQAGVYTQFRLSSFSANFGNNVVVDSLVLTLTYAGYYGDTLNAFHLNVYELTDNLLSDEVYYSNSSINYDNNSLTEGSNLITPTPTIQQDTLASSYYLRIRLKTDFAKDKFISKSGSSVYASDAAFLEYFKGLYLEADNPTGNGCMLSVNMTHSFSGLTIYYSNDQAKNLKYTFNLNDSTVHFGVTNHFDYGEATPDLRDQLNGNYTSAKEILYGQAGAGIKVALNFPYLKETFKDQKVVIHRAMLVVSHHDDVLVNYLPPSALTMTYTDMATGVGYLLPDYYLGLGNDYFGGEYNQTSKEYRFNITQYIQNLVDGVGDNYQLNLLVSPSITHLSRLKMYGTHPVSVSDYDKRMQLKINYTIIDN
jgi:hypothetical protein